MDTATRTVVSIAWYTHRPDWHEVVYSDGHYARLPGSLKDAAALAEALEMDVVPDQDGNVEWHRQATVDPSSPR